MSCRHMYRDFHVTALMLLLTAALPVGGVWIHAEDSLIITEFMAANDRTVPDDLGDFSGGSRSSTTAPPVNLGGYYLTDAQDDLPKWRFPATNLPPQRYLLVYASGRDRSTPGKPLHTNFKLSAEGECLAWSNRTVSRWPANWRRFFRRNKKGFRTESPPKTSKRFVDRPRGRRARLGPRPTASVRRGFSRASTMPPGPQ